jgi:hypothetical protein
MLMRTDPICGLDRRTQQFPGTRTLLAAMPFDGSLVDGLSKVGTS